MNRFFATFISAGACGLVAGIAPAAWAQDATQSQSQTSSPSDTSSPLTPTNPTTSTPLTPSPTNPVSGQSQQTGAEATQSSSEVPTTFVQPAVESNRLDASAPSSLQLEIDPSGSQSASLSSDVPQLVQTTAGLSLNSVQGTTTAALPSPIGGSTTTTTTSISYPTAIAEPTSTQTFLSALRPLTASSASTSRVGSSSASMGPLIGSAAVQSSSSQSSMTSSPTPMGASTFMRAPSASTSIVSPISSTSSSIGPSALRTFTRSSSSLSHHSSGSHH